MNYYYPPQSKSASDEIKTGLRYGIGFGLIGIMVWFTWASQVYRFSEDRLKVLIEKKYALIHGNKLKENEEISAQEIQLAHDKSKVRCKMITRDKLDSSKIFKKDIVQYKLLDDCRSIAIDCIKP